MSIFTKLGRAGKPIIPHTDTNLVHYQAGVKVQADSVLSWAFDMPTTLPTILYRGAGRVAGMLSVFPTSPQMWSPLAIPTNSFGGSQAGKFTFAPLTDTSGDTSGD